MNKIISTFFLLILMMGLYFEEEIRLGWGYDIQMSGDEKYITRYDDIIVGLTIVDLRILPEHIIGLRLPSKDIQCGHKLMRAASDEKIYFILELGATKVTNFYTQKEFEKALMLLPEYERVSLRYEVFENIFKFSQRLDDKEVYKECLERNGLSGRRVVWFK